MSPIFVAAAVVAQLLHWPNAVVGIVLGLCTLRWVRVWPVASLATAIDLALMALPLGWEGLDILRTNAVFMIATVYPAALLHVALGSWIRQRLSRPRAQRVKAWPGPRTRR
jgi:hypothetical protein